ncbi:hypothetical protein [Streptomyces sp. NPDC096033]|uniref:hypothetical protein n=1 Tax=Streptomyces sp. NPDC096033 TaxID=3366071 RepID=UPI0037F78E4B
MRGAEGRVFRDPASGTRTGKSPRQWHKINAVCTTRVSARGSDGKAGVEVAISADLFAWSGLGLLGAWGRADSSRVAATATPGRSMDRYLSDQIFIEQRKDDTKVTYGEAYEVRWSIARPSDDGTRDRQDGVHVDGSVTFTP